MGVVGLLGREILLLLQAHAVGHQLFLLPQCFELLAGDPGVVHLPVPVGGRLVCS